jgi:alkylation response protein AidB-like acyl-CoA dehydrogenase
LSIKRTDGQIAPDEDLVALAQSFGAELTSRAREFEDRGFVSKDLADRLAELGLMRLCNPHAYGGPGRSPMDYGELVETLAQYDGATAWTVFIGITSALSTCQLGPQVASTIFAEPDTITAGVFAPMGRATVCTQDGIPGFRLNGQWQWGSGCHNAAFISGGGFIVDGAGEMLKLATGAPDQRSFFMPIEDVEILDTWHVSGLKGTGSNHFQVSDLFVPEPMTSKPFAMPDDSDPMLRFPLFAALGIGIGAVALGLAAASTTEFLTLAGGKTPMGSAKPLAMKSSTQRAVADASAKLRAARLFFYDAINIGWQQAQQQGAASIAARSDIRLATTHAVSTAVAVIDSLYTLAGGSSVYLSSPLQRHFRDVHVASQHMMVSEATLELVGRIQLGLETNASQL